MSHKPHNLVASKLCILQQFTANILPVSHAQTAAVIPGNHDAADVIHTSHGAFRADRRCLGIVHPNKLYTGTDRIFLSDTFDRLFTRKSHAAHFRF